MPIRPPKDVEEAKQFRQRAGKLVGRIYLLWMLGIAIGAVQLKVQAVGALGLSFAIGKPELLEGMLFLGCLACYLASLAEHFLTPYPDRSGPALIRQIIYRLRRKRTNWLERRLKERADEVSHSNRDRRRFRRGRYIGGLFVTRIIGITYKFLPLVHILGWRREELSAALSAVLH